MSVPPALAAFLADVAVLLAGARDGPCLEDVDCDSLMVAHGPDGSLIDVRMVTARLVTPLGREVRVAMPDAPVGALRYWSQVQDASSFPTIHLSSDAGGHERFLWRFAAQRCAFLLRGGMPIGELAGPRYG